MRIILDQGVSLSDADSIAGLLNADLILGGDVTDYEDSPGSVGVPRVSFSAQLIEKKAVRWSGVQTATMKGMKAFSSLISGGLIRPVPWYPRWLD